MRLFVFNCLLLASVAVASPNGRHKRDLKYLKDLIASAIFGRSQINIQPAPVLLEENGYKLFQRPRYDDVMIKVPKKPVVEEFVYSPAVGKVNLNAFGTVVGTKSKDDTLVAVNEVNNLLSTGILYGRQNNVMKETVVPMFPLLNTPNYVVEEKIKTAPVIKTRPVLTEVFDTRPVFTEVVETRPVFTEVVETRPVFTEVVETRPVLTEVVETGPVFTEEIRSVEENVEPIVQFKPTYSYQQILNNEPVMMYTYHDIPEMELVETIKTKTELPECIKKKANEAIVLGAGPNQFAPVQKVYQYQSPSFVDLSYPSVEAHSHVNNSIHKELTKESDVANGFGLPSQRLRPSKDSPARAFVRNLRPPKTKAINPRPNPLQSQKSPHFEGYISSSKDKVNNLGKKDDYPKTLGEYIALLNNRGRNSIASNGNNKAVPIGGSKDNVSNARIPNNVYKLQRNPNTGKVVEGGDTLRTNVKTNANQYVNGSALNRETAKNYTAQVKNVEYGNKETAKPQSATSPFAVASTDAPKQPLRENIQTSFKHESTENYAYPQKNADGSSLNVNGNKHGVSASVKENNNGGRGDIPDQ